jgi:hypothetical protein
MPDCGKVTLTWVNAMPDAVAISQQKARTDRGIA